MVKYRHKVKGGSVSRQEQRRTVVREQKAHEREAAGKEGRQPRCGQAEQVIVGRHMC